jgi:hypothetical protein
VDVETVLAAVRDVPGVRAADLRTDERGGPTLRLDLADGVDAGVVGADAARTLRERLGVGAGPVVRIDAPGARLGDLEATGVTGGVVDALRPVAGEQPGWHIVIERVQLATAGVESAVEVCLRAGGVRAVGRSGGPAVDSYLLRVAATATAEAVAVLLAGRGRCVIEHVGVVPAGSCESALVVLLLVTESSAERMVGAAEVSGDTRHAVARATLAAIDRRLETLLATPVPD